jgi:hypothetical protein
VKQEIPQATYYIVRGNKRAGRVHCKYGWYRGRRLYRRLSTMLHRYVRGIPSDCGEQGSYGFDLSSRALTFRNRKQAENVTKGLGRWHPGIKFEIVEKRKPYRRVSEPMSFREERAKHLTMKLRKLVKHSDINYPFTTILWKIRDMAGNPLADAFLAKGNKTEKNERERLHTIADIIFSLQRCAMDQQADGLSLNRLLGF